MLSRNWPLKLLALALAFTIWVAVTGEDRVLQDLSIPLEIELSADQVLASQVPNTVSVRLRGAASLMRRLDPVPLAVKVDLSDASPGDHDQLLSAADVVNVPRGVEVEFIDPDRLTLRLARNLQRELPVVVTTSGDPPEGFHYYGAEAFPNSMLVEGPEREIEALETLETNPIPLNLRTEPFVVSKVIPVVKGEYVRVVDPRTLEVRIDVDTVPSVRKLEGILVQVVGPAVVAGVSPARLDVTLTGPSRLLDRILPEQVRLFADASGLEPSTRGQSVEVRAELVGVPARDRNRVTVKEISRRTVSVKINEAEHG